MKAHYQEVRGMHPGSFSRVIQSVARLCAPRPRGSTLITRRIALLDETLGLLVQLARESGLQERIHAMFRGEKINITENRAVLHVALRAPKGASFIAEGENVVPQVHAVLDKMADFSNRVRSGSWKGHTGNRFEMSSISA